MDDQPKNIEVMGNVRHVVNGMYLPQPQDEGKYYQKVRDGPNGSDDRLEYPVYSYNVLCQNLTGKNHLPEATEEDVEEQPRYVKLLKFLDGATNENAIIFLQELTQAWVSRLIPYLYATKGYWLIFYPTHNQYCGYMGIGVVFPPHVYALTRIESGRLADTIELEEKQIGDPMYQSLSKNLSNCFYYPMNKLSSYMGSNATLECCIKRPKTDGGFIDTRMHRYIACEFKRVDHDAAKPIVLIGAHLPCAFKNQFVMHLFVKSLFTQAMKFADTIPFMVVGDFNIKATDPAYKFMTQDDLTEEFKIHEHRELLKMPIVLKSVFPSDVITCHTHGFNGTFTGGLDYMFYSEGIVIVETCMLPTDSCMIPAFMPNQKYALSDHFPLYAKIKV